LYGIELQKQEAMGKSNENILLIGRRAAIEADG
jgi:hypothetical protein